MYSKEEYADMHFIYGEAHGNSRAATQLYAERFPLRRLPCADTFGELHRRLRETGSVIPQMLDRGQTRPDFVLNVEPGILETVEDNPGVSTRQLSIQFGVSRKVIMRTLQEQLLYPYHIQRVQALRPQDYPVRTAFCEWFQEQHEQNVFFSRNILACDESMFTRDGIINYHNVHIWADANPHAIRHSRFQSRFSVNLWAGILDGKLIGPFELPCRLNGRAYLSFLRFDLPNLLFEIVEDIPLERRRQLWFLHDGAPPHFCQPVRNFLNSKYPGRWIGRNGPIRWPPRSPDLTPLDFYFWGHMKDLVYQEEIETEAQLRERILDATNQIRNDRNLLVSIYDNWNRRVRACIHANGRHFEHLL